jgi:hypothetical protein
MRWRRESIIDIYELVLGLFLLASPWLFAFAQETPKIETWAVGAAVVVTSLAATIVFSEWEEWVNAALGVWLIMAPWLLGFAHTRAMVVSIGVGAVLAYLSLLELWLLHYGEDLVAQPTHRPGPH